MLLLQPTVLIGFGSGLTYRHAFKSRRDNGIWSYDGLG